MSDTERSNSFEIPPKIRFARDMSPELAKVVEFAVGKRSEGWLIDTRRFCIDFEANLIGALLLTTIIDEFLRDNPELRDSVNTIVHHTSFAVADVPLYIHNSKSGYAEPLQIDGTAQHAPLTLMKQGSGAPSGIIIRGPLSGLVVEPPSLTDTMTPDSISHLTISRLCGITDLAISPKPPAIYADSLNMDHLIDQLPTDPDRFTTLISAWRTFTTATIPNRLATEFRELKLNSENFPKILSTFCTRYGIPFDADSFNYFTLS